MRIALFITLCFLMACGLLETRPKLEMTFAATAFMAAKDVEASRLAPNYFQKAEYYFLKAKSLYKKKFFNKAKQYALRSQALSEKAEEISIRKKTLETY